jgi:twitching motility protein PilT
MHSVMFDVDAALRRLIEAEGSDLHVTVPAPPLMRVHGHLGPIEGHEPLRPRDTEAVLDHMLSDPAKREEFESEGEVDFSYAVEGCGRFRVNAFRQRGSVALACRAIPDEIVSIEDLGLPEAVGTLADEERGVVLVTGTTGSGKSTTLAAMIDQINRTRSKHVVTVEDPIEFLHRNKRSVINQREVGPDTISFKRALRRILRQDPDVILIGEMRDEETVQTALSAGATGHLVLSTLHTLDAAETVNRIIDFFPPHQHQQARAMLASTLKGIVSQRLVPTREGDGRVAVCEVLRSTPRVRDMIADPQQTHQLSEAIAEGEYYGMQTFDQSLVHLYRDARVSMDEALRVATSPHDFKLQAAAAGPEADERFAEREIPAAGAGLPTVGVDPNGSASSDGDGRSSFIG